MALYRYIHTTFWQDPKVMDDMTPEDRYFYLYLLSNPKCNQIGCYEISKRLIANDLGYNAETIEKLIDRFEQVYKCIKYDNETKELLVLNWHKYNWTTSPKVKSCILKELQLVKSKDFFNYLNRVCIGYGYGIDTVCIPNDKVKVKVKVKVKDESKSKENEIQDDLAVDKSVDNYEDNLTKELTTHYENCFRRLVTPIHIDTLKSFINDGMELDLVKTIMEYSSTKEDPFAYCRKVLNNCMGRKILTKAEFELNLKTKPSSKVQQATNRFTNIYEHNWDFDKLEKLEMEYIDKKVAEMNGG